MLIKNLNKNVEQIFKERYSSIWEMLNVYRENVDHVLKKLMKKFNHICISVNKAFEKMFNKCLNNVNQAFGIC